MLEYLLAEARRRFPRDVRLPRLGGRRRAQLRLSCLEQPVEVLFDAAEVPYIFARNPRDLVAAQGYVHAQHRLFQMEFLRRFARGRISELLGRRPLRWQDTSIHFDGLTTVDLDALLRAFQLEHAAELSMQQVSPGYRALAGAYVRGVNAYLERNRHRRPLELWLLRDKVEPWTALDPFLLYKGFAYHLCFIWTAKLTLNALLQRHPDRAAAMRELIHAGARVPDPAFRCEALAEELAALGRGAVGFSGFVAGAVGSNCWAIGGAHSASGAPLLACDPHLPLMAPSLLYQQHLEAPGIKVAGLGGPGIPGVCIGHNANYAWGLTHAWVDDCDLFAVRFDDQGRCLTPDGPLPLREERLEIAVQGEDRPTPVRLRHGPHGPLISDLMRYGDTERGNGGGPRGNGGGPRGNGRPSRDNGRAGRGNARQAAGSESTAYALRWSGSDGGRDLEGYWRLSTGHNWRDFREACTLLATPALNMIYADRDGHLGYQLAGWVPARGWQGSLDLVDGRQTRGWSGYLPPDELLHSFDPPEGVIISANERIVDDSYPHYLSDLYEPPFRARRAREVLRASGDHTVNSLRRLQLDDYSAWADQLNRDVLQALHPRVRQTGARQALELLAGWDGRFTVEASAPAVFYAFVIAFARRTMRRELGEELARAVLDLYTTPALTVQQMLAGNAEHWFAAGPGVEDQAALGRELETALCDAVDDLRRRFGRDPRRWAWGRIHRRIQRHMFHAIPGLRRLFSVGFAPSPGDGTTVNSGVVRFTDPFDQFGGADARMLVDLGDFDRCRWVLSTGQAGDPISTRYRDQFRLLQRGEDLPWPFSRAAIEAQTRGGLALAPARGVRKI